MCKNEKCTANSSAESSFEEDFKKRYQTKLKLECLRIAKGLAGGSSSQPQSDEELIEASKKLFNFINQ